MCAACRSTLSFGTFAPSQDLRGSSDHWQPEGNSSQNMVQILNTYAIEIVQHNQFGIVTPKSSANLLGAGLPVANG